MRDVQSRRYVDLRYTHGVPGIAGERWYRNVNRRCGQ